MFNEDSNYLENGTYSNYLGEVIASSITEKTGSYFTFSSLFTNTRITNYICRECESYPIISFFCEEEIGIKCTCGFKKISTKNYVKSLRYFEKQIKCKDGGKFVCYCFDCNKDICNVCKNNEPKNHNIKDYEMINKEENIEELKKKINAEMKNEVVEKINPYYIENNQGEIIFQNQLIEDNMKFDDSDFYQYCDEKLGFPPYISLISIILGVIEKYGPNYSHFLNVKSIHLFFEIRKKNRLIIEYKFPQNGEINIFGKKFVENNKDNCEIVFNNKKEELKDKLALNQNEDSLTLILIENNIVTDMSELFDNCVNLVEISDKSYWDTSNVKNMNKMFNDCLSLKQFPEIKGWTTMNVLSLEEMFNNCRSLEEINGLSNWKIRNAENISALFSGCIKLKSLPDLSNWETNKVTKMINLFNKCKSLEEIKGIQNWNISNVDDISGLFCECRNLKSLPDLSLWKKKTNNIITMKKMFKDCNELERLPDISGWDVSKVNDFSKMFYRCTKLESLPDLSKWSPKKFAKMSKMFSECSSLRSLPNISEWFIEKNNLIDGCSSLQKIPRFDNGRYVF